MRSQLSEVEAAWLIDPPRALARIATVDVNGMPHVVPAGWLYDKESNELVLGGQDVPRTRRAKHVRATGRAAVVIDGMSSGPGWSPWAFHARGRARVDESEGTIRVSLDEIGSWGLESQVTAANSDNRDEPDEHRRLPATDRT